MLRLSAINRITKTRKAFLCRKKLWKDTEKPGKRRE